jgi:hypothetical protein
MMEDWEFLGFLYAQLCGNKHNRSFCIDEYTKLQYQKSFELLSEKLKSIKVDPVTYIKTVCVAYYKDCGYRPHPTYLSSQPAIKMFQDSNIVLSKIEKEEIKRFRESYKSKIKETWGIEI